MAVESSQSISRPAASLVRTPDGEDRVVVFLPVATVKSWIRAFDEVVAALSLNALRLGGHGRDLEFIRARILARLDRATMSNRLAKELTPTLAAGGLGASRDFP
jgi:hypothetical protein